MGLFEIPRRILMVFGWYGRYPVGWDPSGADSISLGQLPRKVLKYLWDSSRKIEKSDLAGYSFWFALKTRRVTSSSSIFNLAKGSSRRQPYARGIQGIGV